VAVALVAAFAVVAFVAVRMIGDRQADDGSTAARAPALADAGSLVYLAGSDAGDPRLIVVDVTADAVRPGPTVPPNVLELVDVSDAGPGWVGLERATSDGGVRVSVVRGTTSAADRRELGRGDLAAWGPQGRSLVIATNRPGPAPCALVHLTLVRVLTQEVAWTIDDPGVCGPVLSLSRSAAATYFTARSGDRFGVYLTGEVGVPHLLFDDAVMLTASPVSGFLLDPSEQGSDEGEGVVIAWRGIGGPIPVAQRDRTLVAERVLAWSRDGARVALVGSLGATSGVFLIDASSGTGPTEPVLAAEADDVLDATFDSEGTLFVTAPEGILAYRDGSMRPVDLPDGAPMPDGPIVWIA
jgi:hypothetical protein